MGREQAVVYLSPEEEISEAPAGNLSWEQAKEIAGGAKAYPETKPTLASLMRDANAEVGKSLGHLAQLIANVTEAHTTCIFLVDPQAEVLRLGGAHSLSRDFLEEATIPFGSGLVGWTAENGVRISVSPFEHDSTTLLYYCADQGLKSFVAVPIHNQQKKLIGVISCDSKKTYAFAKVTEKLLLDFAVQAAHLIELTNEFTTKPQKKPAEPQDIEKFIESLREYETETDLLSAAASVPPSLIQRDALVLITTAEGGVGQGVFYRSPSENNTSHRLLEMVCKHKKIICAEKSVQALSSDETENRSFLSVPFRVLGREAGSYNLLSEPFQPFDAEQIALLERISKAVGRELERVRLIESSSLSEELTGIASWKNFAMKAKLFLDLENSNTQAFTVARISLTNLTEIEDYYGIEAATSIMQKLMRLIDQIKGNPSLSCYLYGFQVLLMINTRDLRQTIHRLETLIERLKPEDFSLPECPMRSRLSELLLDGLLITTARYPNDGKSIEELTLKTLRLYNVSAKGKQPQEKAQNVANW